MYVPRSNLDPKFLANVQFLEKKYNVCIGFQHVKDDFIASITNMSNVFDEHLVLLGDRNTSKEKTYVNLSRYLKKNFIALDI